MRLFIGFLALLTYATLYGWQKQKGEEVKMWQIIVYVVFFSLLIWATVGVE